MKIAVIGSGISSVGVLTALKEEHDIKSVTQFMGTEKVFEKVFLCAGNLGSLKLLSDFHDIPSSGEINQNDIRILICKYKNKDLIFNGPIKDGPSSLFVKILDELHYLQFYPIKSFYPLTFFDKADAPNSGLCIGFSYRESNNSDKIIYNSKDGKITLDIAKSNKYSNQMIKKLLRDSLQSFGIDVKFLTKTDVSSSQHISSSLFLNNESIVSKSFTSSLSERVVIADASILPFTPLATIGMTLMATAHNITKRYS